MGGDPGMAARHAIDGIAEAAVETGAYNHSVAAQAAHAAIEFAATLGKDAVQAVGDILSGIAAAPARA
jgi:hypothetical protein